uniref:Uncharacterized protein n=1 Tax=Panagrolaimus sp. ES5 TaxID=591445 RepID=A0AC34F5W8_9BILA
MIRLIWIMLICLGITVMIQADFDLEKLTNDTDSEVREVTQLLKRHRHRFRLSDKADFTKRLGHYRRHKKSMEGFRKRFKKAKFRLNKFSLMSNEEQKKHFGVVLPKDLKPTVKRNAFDNTWSNDVPESFDFRAYGKVSAIKNQGPCGSCWAFSTAAAIESQYLLRFNQTLDLSEQSLVSCNSGAWGCNGGNVVQTLSYVQKNGIASETCMPYTVADGTCSTKCDTQKYYIGGYNHFGYDESKFASFLYNYGPAVVTMYVPPEFMLYDSGILDISKDECVEKNEGLHAMTIVGYTPEYWIIKNSWDTDWGEDGYVRVKRGINFCYLTLEVAAPYLNVTTVLPSTPATLKPTTTTPATPKPTTTVATPPPRPPPTNPPTTVPTRPPPPTTKTTSFPTRPTTTQAVPTRPTTTYPPRTPPTTTIPRRPIPITQSNNQGQQQQQFQGCSSGDGVRTMNDATRMHVLNSFNGKRSEIAHGQHQLANGKRLPPGHNIRKLNYNCTIEYYAQHYASTCQQPNVPGAHMVLLAFPYDISITDAVNQMTRYLFTFSNMFNVTHRPGGIQVFADNSQFAYDESISIGCSFSNKACFTESTKSVITCGITPMQPKGAALYTIGCSGCRADDFCTKGIYKRCDVQLGLCYV